jgi:hypothetical protein
VPAKAGVKLSESLYIKPPLGLLSFTPLYTCPLGPVIVTLNDCPDGVVVAAPFTLILTVKLTGTPTVLSAKFDVPQATLAQVPAGTFSDATLSQLPLLASRAYM